MEYRGLLDHLLPLVPLLEWSWRKQSNWKHIKICNLCPVSLVKIPFTTHSLTISIFLYHTMLIYFKTRLQMMYAMTQYTDITKTFFALKMSYSFIVHAHKKNLAFPTSPLSYNSQMLTSIVCRSLIRRNFTQTGQYMWFLQKSQSLLEHLWTSHMLSFTQIVWKMYKIWKKCHLCP